MATVAVLNIAIKATTTQLRKGLRTATGLFRTFEGRILAFVGAGGVIATLKSTAESIDEMAKASRRLGIATEAMGGLQVAAERSGISIQTLLMGMQRMTRRLAEVANTGKGQALPALQQLGLAIESLRGMRPEEQLRMIADALQRVPDQADRVRIAFQLFDSEGVKLLQTLEGGAAGLDKFTAEAKRLGLTFSAEEAAKVERFNDAMGRVKTIVQGLAKSVVIQLAPAMERTSAAIEGLHLNIKPMIKVLYTFAIGLRTIQLGLSELVLLVQQVRLEFNRFADWLAGLDVASQATRRLESSVRAWRSYNDELERSIDMLTEQRALLDVVEAIPRPAVLPGAGEGSDPLQKMVDDITKSEATNPFSIWLNQTIAGFAMRRFASNFGANLRDVLESTQRAMGVFRFGGRAAAAGAGEAIEAGTAEAFRAIAEIAEMDRVAQNQLKEAQKQTTLQEKILDALKTGGLVLAEAAI